MGNWPLRQIKNLLGMKEKKTVAAKDDDDRE